MAISGVTSFFQSALTATLPPFWNAVVRISVAAIPVIIGVNYYLNDRRIREQQARDQAFDAGLRDWVTGRGILPLGEYDTRELTAQTIHNTYEICRERPSVDPGCITLQTDRLTTLPPALGMLTGITTLHCTSLDQMTEFPEVLGALPHLKKLYIGNNTQPVSFLRVRNQGRSYSCDTGYIYRYVPRGRRAGAALPAWIGRLQHLRKVEMVCCGYETLPNELFELPSTCTVHAEGNGFSAEFVERFQRDLRAYREAHPGKGPAVLMDVYEPPAPVPDTRWDAILAAPPALVAPELRNPLLPGTDGAPAPIAASPIDQILERHYQGALGRAKEFFATLAPHDRNNLVTFITGLNATADAANSALQESLRQRIDNLLTGLQRFPAFREAALVSIADGLTNCDDRVALAWDDIHVLWLIHCRVNSLEESAQLALGYHRLRAVDDWVTEQCRERVAVDKLQVQLHVRLLLKERLGLPILTTDMRFRNIGAMVIPEEVIRAAGERILERTRTREAQLDALCAVDFWRNEIQKRFPGQFPEIDTLPQEGESSGAYQERISALEDERNQIIRTQTDAILPRAL